MFVYIILQVMPIFLTAGTAQYMQHLSQQHYPFLPPQAQPMIQMHMPNNVPGALPPGLPQPILPNLPHLPGMPSLIHPPINIPPIHLPLNGGRLPMVVMPHYTKKKEKKKTKFRSKSNKSRKRNHKRHRARSSSSDQSCDLDSDYEHRKKKKRSLRRNRHEVLTPVVSYITKDGYVVYQKKIKKDKAMDWLELSKARSQEYETKSKKRHEH